MAPGIMVSTPAAASVAQSMPAADTVRVMMDTIGLALTLVKVRASKHSNELRLFHIDDDGIHIGSMLAGHEGLLGGQPSRVESLDGADIEDEDGRVAR